VQDDVSDEGSENSWETLDSGDEDTDIDEMLEERSNNYATSTSV
jgi:hypothetical protein